SSNVLGHPVTPASTLLREYSGVATTQPLVRNACANRRVCVRSTLLRQNPPCSSTSTGAGAAGPGGRGTSIRWFSPVPDRRTRAGSGAAPGGAVRAGGRGPEG